MAEHKRENRHVCFGSRVSVLRGSPRRAWGGLEAGVCGLRALISLY